MIELNYVHLQHAQKANFIAGKHIDLKKKMVTEA
jgi:hypothetical protein